MIRCVVDSVKQHPETKNHVVNLRDDSGRYLPIWIGPDTAAAIAGALEGKKLDRPATHDLLIAAVDQLGARVERAVITRIVPFKDQTEQGVFYATLDLTRGTDRISLDCRPSDAIAVALRAGAPIDVDDELFAKSSVKPSA